MTTTQGAEMSVAVNNSPIQDYSSCMFTLQAIMLHLLIKWLLDSNIFTLISNYHIIKWLFNDNHITGLWCYNNCLLMVTFALLILRNWGPCFWLDLVRSSLLSELLNWPWARTKLPLKLKSNRSFNKDLFNFCCCLALVLIGISVAKLATCNDGI